MSGVKVKERIAIPECMAGAPWRVVGAARLVVPIGEVAAVLVVDEVGGRVFALWWDKDRRALVAEGVES